MRDEESFLRITPYLTFKDIDAAVRFFVDVLDFKAWVHGPHFAYVQREAAAVRIGFSSGAPEEKHEAGHAPFFFISTCATWTPS